jgi:hypothetical protein
VLILAVVTVSGHAGAQPTIYHTDFHHDHHSIGSVDDHETGLVIQVAGDPAATASCSNDLCEPGSETSGAHFHIPCCGAVLGMLPSDIGIEMITVESVALPIRRSSLALGELHFPLLRPPCRMA